RAGQTLCLQLLHRRAHVVVQLQNFPAAALALLDRLRDRLVEEGVDPAENGLVRAAAQSGPLLVTDAEREKRRLLELERESRFRMAPGLLRQRARHADRFERL